ncbi:MAG: AzlC family ABC transporter permease [Atopobiaceae bacterium]|nr:AzlC family ABC transporter permease [Atopobiaceae bacterium]
MSEVKTNAFVEGLRDGFPIGLGYLAVAFSLGIAAKNAGLDAFQGFMASLLNIASAGEYVGFTMIAAQASYLEIALGTLVTNARYLLMSTALSQRFDVDTPFIHRIGVGLGVTDELFGLAIAKPKVVPVYQYGAMLSSIPLWCIGTSAGIIAGELLPARVVTALSVSLFGMFLAVIMPAAREDKVVRACVFASFAASYVASHLIPLTMAWSSGTRTIVLTVIIAAIAAVLWPVGDEEDPHEA